MTNREKIKQWQRILKDTEVLQMPKQSIATFGPTHLAYYCLSSVGTQTTRIRHGIVLAEKPQIYLPNETRELFEGFTPEAREFADELLDQTGNKLKALGYTFRHQLKETRTERLSFRETAEVITDRVASENRIALLRGMDAFWEISLIKFTIEIAAKSFPSNLTELEERGFFDPDKKLQHQIAKLFYQASRSSKMVPVLCQFLKENQVFEEYEDRFFELALKNSKTSK